MKLVVAKRLYQYRDHFEVIFRDFNFLGERQTYFHYGHHISLHSHP